MYSEYLDKIIIALSVVFSTILIALVVTHVAVSADAKSQCLSRGYPDYRVDWKFTQYCVNYDLRSTVPANKNIDK